MAKPKATSNGRFAGFSDPQARFFKALAKNNEREWFLAHKSEFEQGWNEPMRLLLAEVREAIDAAFPHCDLAEPKVFRIFRDVRFSKDKSPYKTHIGGFLPLARHGKKTTDLPMALYFHVGATETFGAAGHYMMEPDSLERFRKAVADDKKGKELEKLLAGLRKKGFEADSHDRLQRVPKGFDPDHPRADLPEDQGPHRVVPRSPGRHPREAWAHQVGGRRLQDRGALRGSGSRSPPPRAHFISSVRSVLRARAPRSCPPIVGQLHISEGRTRAAVLRPKGRDQVRERRLVVVLHRDLGVERETIAPHRGDGQGPALLAEGSGEIPRLDVAVDVDPVPGLPACGRRS